MQLSGGDLRSLGRSDAVVRETRSQADFDRVFQCLYHEDPLVVMRAADVIEKITASDPTFLQHHKKQFIRLTDTVQQKELQWHLALLYPRFKLTTKELGAAWDKLTQWAKDKNNSRIVRVNSIQGLYGLLKNNPELVQDLLWTFTELEQEKIPSLDARIRRLRKKLTF